jgi:GWxTD domain-containing protein
MPASMCASVRRVRPIPLKSALNAIGLVAVFLLAPAVAGALDTPTLRAMQPPFFSADVSVTIDTLAHPSVSVTITVPYAELNWSSVAAGYAAGAGFTVELDPVRGDRLFGDTWEKRLTIASYAATHSSRSNLIVQRSFEMPPGRYRVRVHVRDIGSDRESEAQDQLVLEDLSRVPVGFADLLLGVVDSSATWTPVPTRVFGYNTDRLGARVMACDRRPGPWPRQVNLHYRVLDSGSDVVRQGDTTLTQVQQAQPLVVSPVRGSLFVGDYTLEIERIEGRARWRTTRSFEVEESGPPRGKEFTQMLEALAYIATSEEVDAMRNLSPEQQAAAWERFWSRRDPTPDTPRNEFFVEFFRRLHYASEHFQGFGAGWRSDMGRIYIRYGPPDTIEQHPASASTPAAELWSYNQPYRRFVFFDREGFGRYTLAQPSTE